MTQSYQTDVLIIGGGLAGLVAAHKAAERGRKVMLLDQEGEQSLGGQAFWSLGGLCMIDTPEQRRMKIKDSQALATQDWYGSAQFDREEDANPKAFAAIGAVYAGHQLFDDSLALDMAAKVFALVVVIVIVNTVWLAFGSLFSNLLSHPRLGRIANILFALMLVASVGVALVDG